MGRDVPFDEDAVCDRCGRKGAHDFMGDAYCDECLTTDKNGNVVVKDEEPESNSVEVS